MSIANGKHSSIGLSLIRRSQYKLPAAAIRMHNSIYSTVFDLIGVPSKVLISVDYTNLKSWLLN
jgi:hypothetical protein